MKIKADEFERRFDNGEDVTAYLEVEEARRPAIAIPSRPAARMKSSTIGTLYSGSST